MSEQKNSRAEIRHIDTDLSINDLRNKCWIRANNVCVTRYWNDTSAPEGRHLTADLLWSDSALYVRFDAFQCEPLVVNETPRLDSKSMNLWERDVCEIFVAPDITEPRKYFEFEVAPTGEWLDLGIDSTSGERVTDRDYHSGMQAAGRKETDRVVIAMKIPWEAFGRRPKIDDVWLGNIFRCVGQEPDRGYLSWQPTMTEKPNFHVPEKFGELVFQR